MCVEILTQHQNAQTIKSDVTLTVFLFVFVLINMTKDRNEWFCIIVWNMINEISFILFKNNKTKKGKPFQIERRNENGKELLVCSNNLNEGRDSGILSSTLNISDCYVWFQSTSQCLSPWISNIVINGMWFNNNQLIIFNNKLKNRSNWVRDELTFNASDNDVAPDSPILFQMECDSIIINLSYSIINSIPGSNEWVMN